MILRSLVSVAIMLAGPAWADTTTRIGVWGVFYHGLSFPGQERVFHMRLSSDQADEDTEIAMPVFSKTILDSPFEVPLIREADFTIFEAGKPLVTIRFTSKEGSVSAQHACLELPELSTAFPFKHFPAYLAPGLLRLSCPTEIGTIDVQFTCESDNQCW